LDRDVRHPRWAPDSSGVYFSSDDKGNSGLYFISLSGDVRKVASNLGGGTSAYGTGGTFSLARNGAYAFSTARPNLPADIAVGLADGAEPKTITAVNEGLLTGRKLGQV